MVSRGEEAPAAPSRTDAGSPRGLPPGASFWGAVCAAALGLFLFGLLPARREHERAAAVGDRLEREIEVERRAREILSIRRDALEAEDPDEVERELRDRGFSAPGTVTVLPADR